MISSILNKQSPLFWLLFHVALGAASTVTPWLLIVWFYLVLVTTGPSLFRKTEGTFVPLVSMIAYTTSFELLARMSGTSPFIPYELGKYLMLATLLFGISKGFRRGYIGWLMFLLLIPAAFIDTTGETTFRNIVFNLIGPLNLALAVVFFRQQEMEKGVFIDTMRLMFYPLVAVLAFTVFNSPALADIEFILGANFETSGGFGSNQVSTALGLGAFLVFMFWRKRWDLTGFRWLEILLLLFIVFRGLVTFSRGGMVGGALGIILFLLLEKGSGGAKRDLKPVRAMLAAIPIFLVLVFTFIYADKVTGGLLSKRYQGETPGTMAGRKEKTLNVFTSNRLQILSDDLKLWKEHPVLGVGVGASQHLRDKSEGFLSHVEISRLLSEHGILGMIYTIILLYYGFKIFRQHKQLPLGGALAALYVIALFTTFHAAMRTYISPLLFGLSMLTIVEEEDCENGNES